MLGIIAGGRSLESEPPVDFRPVICTIAAAEANLKTGRCIELIKKRVAVTCTKGKLVSCKAKSSPDAKQSLVADRGAIYTVKGLDREPREVNAKFPDHSLSQIYRKWIHMSGKFEASLNTHLLAVASSESCRLGIDAMKSAPRRVRDRWNNTRRLILFVVHSVVQYSGGDRCLY